MFPSHQDMQNWWTYLHILNHAVMKAALFIAVVILFACFEMFFLGALYMQRILGYDALHDVDEVRHVEEVAHRVAAEAFLPGLQALVERGDRPDSKPRPGDVSEPQRDDGHLAQQEVLLSGRLGDPIARERVERMCDRNGHLLRPAIAERGLEIDQAAIRVIAGDPPGSIFATYHRTGEKGEGAPYKVEGIGNDKLPSTLDFSVIDEYHTVTDRDAFRMGRRMTREEGLFVGGSAGLIVWLGARIAQEVDDPDACIVCIVPDTGERYLSTPLFEGVNEGSDDEWLKSLS